VNQQALKNIISHHDTVSDHPLAPSYLWKMQRDDFCSPELLEPLLLRLSDLREREREKALAAHKAAAGSLGIEEDTGSPKDKVQRNAFERTSIKFWVKPDKIIKLVCAVLKHQSVYCFTGGYAQQTSSVYFDNDALDLYAARLIKEEGAKLIRFRWYGQLDDDSQVFIERKVHHEKWVMEASVKERCTLVHHKIMEYIKGEVCETPAYCKKYPLFEEVQQAIVNERLKPVLKTEYMRTAFQVPHDDSVRLTMDTKLNMLRELDSEELENLQDWHTPTTVFQEHSVHRFPFAVLEVKLHAHLVDNPPKWLNDIWNSDMLIRLDKFSKFNHGTAVLYPEIVDKLPYWFDGHFAHFFASDKAPRKANREVRGASFFFSPGKGPSDLEVHRREISDTQMSRSGTGGARHRRRTEVPSPESVRMPKPFQLGETHALTLCLNVICPCFKSRDGKGVDPVSKRMRIEPKTFFANERTYLQWFNAATLIATVGLAMVGVGGPLTIVGFCFVPIAILILLYALAMYTIRSQKLRDREPSLVFADVLGPTVLTIILSLALVFLTLYSFGIFGRPVVVLPPVEIGGKALLRPSCSLGLVMRGGLRPAALAYRAQDNTLWGAGDGVIFSVPLNVRPPISSINIQFIVPTYFGTARILRDYAGAAFFSPASDSAEKHLMIGAVHDLIVGPSLLRVDLATNDIVQRFDLGAVFPSSGLLSTPTGLRGLAFVPSNLARGGGFFFVGNDVLDDIFIYDLPLDLPPTPRDSTPVAATLVRQWTPLQGARRLLGLTYWAEEHRILVFFGRPYTVAMFDVDPSTGLPSLIPLKLFYGFDLPSARALVVVPRPEQAGNPAFYVADDEFDTIASYNFSSRTGGFSSCIT
jgi:hypothetical protein